MIEICNLFYDVITHLNSTFMCVKSFTQLFSNHGRNTLFQTTPLQVFATTYEHTYQTTNVSDKTTRQIS